MPTQTRERTPRRTSRKRQPNPFREATPMKRPLKLLIYGPPGSGKTSFAMTAPRAYVIDTDGGAGTWAHSSNFLTLRTASWAETLEAVEWVAANLPENCETLVVDNISVIYDVLRETALKRAECRAAKSDTEPELAEMTPGDWIGVRARWRKLLTRLLSLPVHVVLIAREKRTDDELPTGDRRAVDLSPDADESLPYYADVVGRMTTTGGSRELSIVKDRWWVFPAGSLLPNPVWNDFAPILVLCGRGEEPPARPTHDDPAEQDLLRLDEAPRRRRQVDTARLLEAVRRLRLRVFCLRDRTGATVTHPDLEHHAWRPWLRRHFGVDRLADVPPADLPKMVAMLRAQQPGAFYDYQVPADRDESGPFGDEG